MSRMSRTVTETISSEFQASSTEDRLKAQDREDHGQYRWGYGLAGLSRPRQEIICPGTLTRIAAAQDEDPQAIKVFDLSIEVSIDHTAVSDCSGRGGPYRRYGARPVQ